MHYMYNTKRSLAAGFVSRKKPFFRVRIVDTVSIVKAGTGITTMSLPMTRDAHVGVRGFRIEVAGGVKNFNDSSGKPLLYASCKTASARHSAQST